jgi:hypothetical protein
MTAILAGSRWSLDWTAVAAIATAVLALFTWRLAYSTRTLAQATRQDVSAAWRPVLIGAATHQGESRIHVVATPGTELGTADVTILIANVGSGPALNIELVATSFGSIVQGPTTERLGTLGPKPTDYQQVVTLTGQRVPVGS